MKTNSTKTLTFEEFESCTKKKWKEKAKADLKSDELSILNWCPFQDNKNFVIEPYYSKEDLEGLEYLQHYHEIAAIQQRWKSYVSVSNKNPDFSERITSALENGVDGISIKVLDKGILESQLEQLWRHETDFLFHFERPGHYLETILSKGGAFKYCISDEVIRTDQLGDFITQHPKGKFISISSDDRSVYGQLQDYLFKLDRTYREVIQAGIDPEKIHRHLFIHSYTSQNYFLEIAKIRALKILIRAFFEAWYLDETPDIDIVSVSRPGPDKAYEPHSNMIKSTYAAMSAIIGGCDVLVVEPEDETNLTLNVASHLSTILAEEAHLDKVSDPAGGSYFIENLTQQLVTQSWQQFLKSTT